MSLEIYRFNDGHVFKLKPRCVRLFSCAYDNCKVWVEKKPGLCRQHIKFPDRRRNPSLPPILEYRMPLFKKRPEAPMTAVEPLQSEARKEIASAFKVALMAIREPIECPSCIRDRPLMSSFWESAVKDCSEDLWERLEQANPVGGLSGMFIAIAKYLTDLEPVPWSPSFAGYQFVIALGRIRAASRVLVALAILNGKNHQRLIDFARKIDAYGEDPYVDQQLPVDRDPEWLEVYGDVRRQCVDFNKQMIDLIE